MFIAPAVAYFVTKRICLGLQRKDLHLLQHGVETGIIRQLPSGEYIEETRPLTDEELAALDVKPRPSLPAPAAQAALEVPPPQMRGGLGRVREQLDRVLTESVPIDAHGDGYGAHGNGHGNGHPDGDAEAEHAALPTGGDQQADGSGDDAGGGPA